MFFRAKAVSLWCLAAASMTSSAAFSPRVVFAQQHVNNKRVNQVCVGGMSSSGTCLVASSPAAALYSRGGSTASLSTTALNSAVVTDETAAAAPVEIFRKDYQPLPMIVSKINMDFSIHEGKTMVHSELYIEGNPAVNLADGTDKDLVLDGDETALKLLSITLNEKELEQGKDYILEPGKLILKNPPPKSVLKTTVEIVPEENTQLSGLYKSDSMYCTQCEAMGFRRITYYPDRPDNMAVFERVRLEASKKDYPVLLANGNLLEEGDLDGDRHFAVWSDPFPKPSYLFCCVAGNLGKIADSFTTSSGRKVDLQLFSEPDNVHKLQYAMDSLKRSMKWDEDVYGLEYDLDLYNIVAVNSFNMGAMENKGLNVFNTAYVLADQATATDTDFERVEGVIGHEYFHNWTGNRVTCRDWFQLTLKEGLTVFRDQEFSGDMNSKAVNRIENVQALRARQFAEDAGPMSHPIRPESYISMDNFYTSTVYNKGAEIIRMYQTLLGKDGFRKGMDLYFERHDGSAVTCDDFLAAMADANGVDLSQFSLWYSTPGTPVVSYSYEYDQPSKKFKLTLTQESKSESGPLHIPISVGLLDKNTGEDVVPTTVLDLKKEKQTFEFENLSGDVVPSILRQFSAPVKLVAASGEQDEEALAFLAARDTDGFNKWEAGQVLFTNLIFQVMDGKDKTASKTWDFVKEAFGRTLNDYDSKDYSIVAYALNLPTESTLAELVDVVDPIAIHKSRGHVKRSLAREFHDDLLKRYKALTDAMSSGEFKVDAESIGQRRLRNICMDYLCSIRETPQEQIAAAALAKNHYESATCMTDKVAALNCLASMDGEGASARDEIIKRFYDEAEGDALVLNKWFSIQAMADLPDILDRVKALKAHPDFTLKNPNRCRSLVGAFSMNSAFHDESGAGYRFIREVLEELDPLNPQISSRLAGSLITWKKYDEERGLLMKTELEKLSKLKPISDDMFEIVSRGLK
ncbi:aminopeptidase N [Nitzschia inconspicua]|uniref:Aminopeptidase N n=1 Tax=Nitzschia inconspicua TaxID=303405 RepID=A0A9K3M1P5_9STRA|nr:aminopeptidase N [Nitzschia inconspicua]